MQGIVYVPDCHLQTGSPPPNRISVPQMNMDVSPELDLNAKEIIVNQSNHSDSGILSATGNSTFMDTDRSSRFENEDIDNRSNCSSPDRKYLCPICETMLTSQHEFTLHIRSHNNESEAQDSEKGFVCRICSRVLSSSASLDRHMLIHSGERPFMCKYCGDTFTTNGNMHRHMRTHTNRTENYESDGSTDSGASSGSKTVEYNNNKISSKSTSNKSTLLGLKPGADNKRKYINYEAEETYKQSRIKLEENSDHHQNQNYTCPVCDRDDFNSIDTLEVHLEDNHPDYPAKCNHCSQIFKNNKLLNEHKSMIHYNEENNKHQRNSVVGFKDLTFVDFSSQKFPYIAKYECEKNLHKVASGLKFQCEKCSRAFPCASSLEIHQSDCTTGLDLSVKNKTNLNTNKNLNSAEKDIRRNDFFARLDLQNNSQEQTESPQTNNEKISKIPHNLFPTTDSNKDLADIQSIISMTTNGTLLQQLQAKTIDVNSSLRSICTENEQEAQKHENEEESQDLFAAEFRKMKLRGEFPCRLCTAVFPNLRALKGHNRAHLNGNNNGTYRCNMCPHSSIDKAALIRHMRTHNGDRPYECSLCNYAFTTKANCERHLRNRHAKSTREEVKKSIIYHPSEDPSNEEISKMLAREENSKGNVTLTTPKIITDTIPEKVKIMTPESYLPTPDLPNLLPEKRVKDVTSPVSVSNSLLNVKSVSPFNLSRQPPVSRIDVSNLIPSENLNPLQEHNVIKNEPTSPYMPPFSFSPKITNTSTPQKIAPKINVKNIESMQCIEHDDEDNYTKPEFPSLECDDQPIDLVLDLSKKKVESKPEEIPKPTSEDIPQDLSKKTSEIGSSSMSDILARQLLKNTPKIDPASLYASQLAIYRNGFPGLHGLSTWPFSLNPMLFQAMPSPLFPQDPHEIKERLQRLQLCGGGMVMDNFAERLKNFHQKSLSNTNLNAFNNFKLNDLKPELNLRDNSYTNHSLVVKSEEIKPLSLNIDQNLSENLIKMQSPLPISKSEPMASPNSVKMVIKNGVLMPKQKQRRYRTERPFSCEYCSARFTLRSNMERHIKQQHPQFWSQRQRSNVGGGNRKIQSGNVNSRNSYCNINIPNYDTPKKQSYDDTKDNQISEKIKYVILAQHLKAAQNYKATKQDQKIKEEDEDFELVIDEKEEALNKIEEQENNNKHSDKEINASSYGTICKTQILEEKLKQFQPKQYTETSNPDAIDCSNNVVKNEDAQDLVPVARLLDNASQQPFKEYFRRGEGREGGISEEDEEGLVASSSTSDGNNSGTDENRSESENATTQAPTKKKSAYSLAPNRVSCPYCQRKFPWTSSLRRHVLTHTGQKPFKCSHCPLLFTTKSNCDRHLLRKHGNSATAINNDHSNNNSNYMMRNVPERPFKCSSCPSSTFSTYSNLKKHISCKHSSQGAQSDDAHSQVSTGYEAGSSEDEKMSQGEQKSDWDKQITSHNKTTLPSSEVQNPHLQNSDLPFKCHLCDNSFGERHDAIDHIKDRHSTEYELLMSKNAFDANATTPDDNPNHEDNEDNEVRGKFPDYANRKVICAFCMRRFWSAEDLRRHMRTHTGERPFSCDICHRRFTLKHSMLRHRKKHNLTFESDNVNSDEDVNNANLAPAFDKFVKGNNNNLVSKGTEKTDESDGTEGSDLISNLLGIRDRSIIDQVLAASPDDAAKLLGVKGGE